MTSGRAAGAWHVVVSGWSNGKAPTRLALILRPGVVGGGAQDTGPPLTPQVLIAFASRDPVTFLACDEDLTREPLRTLGQAVRAGQQARGPAQKQARAPSHGATWPKEKVKHYYSKSTYPSMQTLPRRYLQGCHPLQWQAEYRRIERRRRRRPNDSHSHPLIPILVLTTLMQE